MKPRNTEKENTSSTEGKKKHKIIPWSKIDRLLGTNYSISGANLKLDKKSEKKFRELEKQIENEPKP